MKKKEEDIITQVLSCKGTWFILSLLLCKERSVCLDIIPLIAQKKQKEVSTGMTEFK